MNVLLITWHDLGRHLGCYGRKDVRSPALDRLASEGARMDALFATNPICSPARGSLFSGMTPHRHGLQGLTNHGWRLNSGVRLVEEWFADAGYHTALVGHQHERPAGECRADDVWTESSRAAEVVPQVCSRLKDYAQSKTPFFLRAGFFEVHRPLLGESDEGWKDVEPLSFLKDTEEHRQQLAKYHKLIERADAGVGAILEALDQNGLAANTLVVFTTDHGVPFPGAKLTLYDAGLEIAGIFRAPGRIAPGTSIKNLASGTDLLPTLLDFCEVSADVSGLDGSSFAPALRGEACPAPDFIFSERAMPAVMRSVRSERYKYIVNFEVLPPSRLLGTEELRTPLAMSLPDFLRRNTSTEELYDLESDPNEQCNLASNPAFAGIREDMNSRLGQWMRDTGDPVIDWKNLSPAFERALQCLRLR